MRGKSSKRWAVLLAVTMAFTLGACGGDNSEKEPEPGTEGAGNGNVSETEDSYYNEEGYPICDETITIKVSGKQGSTPDWNNVALVEELEKRLGIKLECEPVSDEAWDTQYAAMLSTGDIPDLLINCSMDKTQVNEDGEAGFWLDLSQYLDLMPNFQALMEENPQWAAYTQTESGAIYSIFRFMPGKSAGIDTQIYANTKLLEGAGVNPEEIKTVDDFYNALVAVKAAYPDKIPFAMTPDVAPAHRGDMILRTSFGIPSDANSYMLFADENGTVSLGDISDNNREYLKFANKLYEEGLLDPNCFITTKDEYRANEKEGKYVFFADFGSVANAFAEGETVFDYTHIFALSSDVSSETTYMMKSSIAPGAHIFVNAKTEYPEAICRLIDYMCTEEGIMLARYGVEGEHYDYIVDEFGVPAVDATKYADLSTYATVDEWQNNVVTINQALNMKWNFLSAAMDDLDTETLEQIAASDSANNYNAYRILKLNEIDNVVEAMPPLVYTSEEASERSTLYADINNYLVQMKVSFMTGEVDVEDDAAWENYVQQVKKMGYDRLMEIEQAAYDRYYANLK